VKMKLTDNPLQVGIITSDSDRAEHFYTEVLGLPKVEPRTELPGGGEIRRVRCGDVIIKLNRPGTPPPVGAPSGKHSDATGIRYLTFAIENAREIYDEVSAAGYTIPMELRESPSRIVFFVQDPDGNNLEFVQDLRGA
jgi:catechol 2,3-dioxygenase-like lactoylglutathione lyase family enzyme